MVSKGSVGPIHTNVQHVLLSYYVKKNQKNDKICCSKITFP